MWDEIEVDEVEADFEDLSDSDTGSEGSEAPTTSGAT